jgi:carboxymethylenebutenolidase
LAPNEQCAVESGDLDMLEFGICPEGRPMKRFPYPIVALVVLAAGCQRTEAPAADSAQQQLEATAAAHSEDSPTPTPMADDALAGQLLEQDLAYGEIGNRNLNGFLAMPADAAEPLPGLIVIHEWWGLNDNIRAVTRRLAAEGYIALAVDLYGGQVAESPERAEILMADLMANPEPAQENLKQAYQYLEKYAFSPAIGSIGWCLGGGWSLQTALLFPEMRDAMVMYYGQVVTDRSKLEPVNVPMLGLFAEYDDVVPVREVQAFRSLLNSLGKDSQIRIYSNVGHAFANPSGGSYDPEAAEDAWRRTLEFLDAKLHPVAP